MKITITADRIRAMIAGCRDEKQVIAALKAHKVRYKLDPYAKGCYALNLYIPCKTGKIRIYRSCSRRAPFIVQHMTPVTFQASGVPVFRPSMPYGSPYTGI